MIEDVDAYAGDRKRFTVNSDRTRRAALLAVASIPLLPDHAYYVEVGDADLRLPEQVRHVFKRCAEIAAVLPFPGTTDRADAESWYRLLLGLMRGERFVRVGQIVVMLGGGLSVATRKEAADLILFIEAYGAERGVRFTED